MATLLLSSEALHEAQELFLELDRRGDGMRGRVIRFR